MKINLRLFGDSSKSLGTTGIGARRVEPFDPEKYEPAFQPTEGAGVFDEEREWKDYTDSFGVSTSDAEHEVLYKSFDPRTFEVYGYIRTSNAMRINEQLYDPANVGKSDEEIFTRKDRSGRLKDLETVKTLDKKISQGKVPKNSIFVRFANPDAAIATLGMSKEQQAVFKEAISARRLDADSLSALNKAFNGTRTYSNSYTSTSANRDWNVFSHYKIERRIYTPAGTKAYAAKDNKAESEVVFGRRMQTEVFKVTVSSKGNLVFHERFVGYKNK